MPEEIRMSLQDQVELSQIELNEILQDPTHPYHNPLDLNHKVAVERVRKSYEFIEKHGQKKPGAVTFEPKIGLRMTLQGKNP